MELRLGSLLFASALASMVAAPALAADLPVTKAPPDPPAPACLWCGFYVGENVGGAWGSSSISANSGFPVPPFLAVDVGAVSSAASPTIASGGFTGGVQAGYNMQNGNWVWGLEADLDYLGLNGSKSGTFAFPSTLPGGAIGPPTMLFSTATKVSTDWLITARPRIGYAWDRWLFYVTGGLAIGQEKVSQTITVIAPNVSTNRFSSTRVGWTVGGGVEYALSKQWSLKGEYLYVDLGKTGANGAVLTPAFAGYSGTASADLTANIGRVGLDYHF